MKSNFKSLALTAFSTLLIGSALIGCGNKDGGTTTTTGGTTTTSGDGGKPSTGGLKLGLAASLNGALKPWGEDSQKGAKLAVEEINAAGGIKGKMIELIEEDTKSTPEDGKTAAERLIEKGSIAIVGEVASGITAQIANAAEAKKIPVIAVGATKTDLPGIGDWVARVCYVDDLQGPVMATFAREKGLKNVALITDNKQPYSQYLSKTFKDSFIKQGGTITGEEFYESGQTQFAALLANVKAKNPDGLFLSGYFNEVGPIVRQAKEAGINAIYMGGDGWDSAEILTSGGDAILGAFFCNHYNNQEKRPEVQGFLEKWKAKYGGVPGTTMGALGYDAVKLAADAMSRASDPANSEEVRKAMQETEGFAGVSGIITLKGKGGNPDKRALVVKLAKDGQVFEKAYEAADVKK